MLEAECRQVDVRHFASKLRPRHLVDPWSGRTRFRSKMDRLVDSYRGEVNIILWAILHITPIVFLHIFGGKTIVVDVAFDFVKLFAVVSQDLKKRTTARSWTTEHH